MHNRHALLRTLAIMGVTALGVAPAAHAGHVVVGIGFGLPGIAVVAPAPYYYDAYYPPAYVAPPYYGYAYYGRPYWRYAPRYERFHGYGYGPGHGYGHRR